MKYAIALIPLVLILLVVEVLSGSASLLTIGAIALICYGAIAAYREGARWESHWNGDTGSHGETRRVEVAPDYRAELCVPFTSEQLTGIEGVAQELGLNPVEAAQRLVGEALAERAHR
jgi:hypothetical protein